MNNSTASEGHLEAFHNNYKFYHGHISLFISIWGVITNVINIIILTRKSMRSSINCVLSGIALADIITMTSYIIFALRFYILTPNSSPERNTYAWMTFLVIHINLSLTSHTVSIWLGVIMAIMRYTFVRPTSQGAKSISLRTSIVIIVVTYVCAAVLIIPNCLITGLSPQTDNRTNLTMWRLTKVPIGKGNDGVSALVIFWLYPVLGKIIPVIFISIFGGLLLHTLSESDKRGRRLKGDNSHHSIVHRRTTIMLLAIIFIYVVSEVPQSILVVLSAVVKGFFNGVYYYLSDLIDAMSLMFSAINFILYCTMSQQFRACLIDSFHACGGCLSQRFRSLCPKPQPPTFV